jgi:hypothetical protein
VTNNLGCRHTLVLYPWGPLSTTQQAQALAAGFTLHPNPATGAEVTLRLKGLRAQGPIAGQLLDGLGRELRHFTLLPQAGAAAAIPVADLAAGVYSLRLLPAEGPLVKRLVKQ